MTSTPDPRKVAEGLSEAELPICVGTSWHTGGKEWTVYEVLPFGRARVRSGFRFGEMNFRSIRAILKETRHAD